MLSLKEWFDNRGTQDEAIQSQAILKAALLYFPLIMKLFVVFLTRISTLGFNYSLLMETQAGVIKVS